MVLLENWLDGVMDRVKSGKFDPEVKAAALAAVADSGRPIKAVARELGIDHRTLWGWVNAAKLEKIDPAGELTPEVRNRIRDLEKENARLRRDLDFEKKAKALFRELGHNSNDSL
jgi:transposase-like protein